MIATGDGHSGVEKNKRAMGKTPFGGRIALNVQPTFRPSAQSVPRREFCFMPFESPNHTQAPNDLFDCLMKEMTESELKVTLAVIRGTLGYHRNGFDLSLAKMADMTGLSENGVMAGAKAAEQRGTIERVNNGRQTTNWRVLFSTSASEVRRKWSTSASEARLPQPVRQTTSASEGQSRVKESIKKEKETTLLAAVFDAYFNCGFGQITAMAQEYVTEAVNEYTAEWVIEAMRAASKANAHSWKYVEAVLQRWKKEGYQSNLRSPIEMRSVAIEEYS